MKTVRVRIAVANVLGDLRALWWRIRYPRIWKQSRRESGLSMRHISRSEMSVLCGVPAVSLSDFMDELRKKADVPVPEEAVVEGEVMEEADR